MKLGTADKFWCVVDATRDSTLADICFETSIEEFILQIKGGLTAAEHPTFFSLRLDAVDEAMRRIEVAMRRIER